MPSGLDSEVILEVWLHGPKGTDSERGRYLRGKLRDAFNDTKFSEEETKQLREAGLC